MYISNRSETVLASSFIAGPGSQGRGMFSIPALTMYPVHLSSDRGAGGICVRYSCSGVSPMRPSTVECTMLTRTGEHNR